MQIWPLSFYLTSTFFFLLQILNLPSINKTLVTITENYRQRSGFPELGNILLCLLSQHVILLKQWLQVQKCLRNKTTQWFCLLLGVGLLMAVSAWLLRIIPVQEVYPGVILHPGVQQISPNPLCVGMNCNEFRWHQLKRGTNLYPGEEQIKSGSAGGCLLVLSRAKEPPVPHVRKI